MKYRTKNNKGESFPQFEINDEEFQVLVGSTLGDGNIRKKSARERAKFQVMHKSDHKDYVYWKAEVLKRFEPKVSIFKPTGSYRANTRVNENLNPLRQLFYPEGKKVVPKELLYRLDELGLAVWYMDDGTYSKRYKTSVLCTCGFKVEEVQMIMDFLREKFGLHTKINKRRMIMFRKEATRELIEVVREHIHPCFKYKTGG